MTSPSEILYEHWGYSSFRPLQEEIINDVVSGKDTLALLPTGGGKSICYQVPAMLREGLCVVVSPLLALMRDQMEGLKTKGIQAETVNSQLAYRDIDRILDNCIYGQIKFLFIAPERLSNALFLERLSKMNIGLIAVDEAHCISQWGHEFRPAYRKINEIRAYAPAVPIIALTATATPVVVQDIQEQLAFKGENIRSKSFARDNIEFQSIQTEDKRAGLLSSLKKSEQGAKIVYVRNRRRCMELSQLLNAEGYSSTYYHAGLDSTARIEAQKKWLDGDAEIVVATNAFGMGIDKSNVRLVIHFDLSDSIESYYQEAGRAGRDGQAAKAIQLFNQSDIDDSRKKLARSYPDVDTVKNVYQVMSDRLGLAAGSGFEESFGIDLSTLAKNCGIGVISTLGALKCLEHNGYIQVHKGLREPSRIQIKKESARLLSKNEDNDEVGNLVRTIIRHRTGLFASPVAIREEELAKLTGESVKNIELNLDKAQNRGILDYHKRKGNSSISYVMPRQHYRDLSLNVRLMSELRDRTVRRQNALIYYLQNDLDCRMAQLISYFGEPVHKGCGICDVCTRNIADANDSSANALLYKIRMQLEDPIKIDRLKEQFSLHDPKRAEILRWSIDKGFITIEDNKFKWTGPYLREDQRQSSP